MKISGIYKAVPFLFALSSAFLLSGMLLTLLGENPFRIYHLFIIGAFGTWQNVGNTLFQSTPLIFTGLAVALAFRAGLFNIGAEGQLYWGAFAAFLISSKTAQFPGLLPVVIAIIGAFVAGGIWGWIPGFLKSRFGAHEVVITIMLNFIALASVNYLITGPFQAPGDQIPQTVSLPESVHLSGLGDWLNGIGFSGLEETPVNTSLLLALVMALLVYILLWKTKFGFNIRAVGLNPTAARAAGISVAMVSAVAIGIGGGLAGLVGINEVLGYRYQLIDNFSPGYGYTGIAVALLGRNHPAGIVLAALLFGALSQGGLIVDIYSDTVSKDVIYVIQGIIMLCVISEGAFRLKKEGFNS